MRNVSVVFPYCISGSGALTQEGIVTPDCGVQQTFTCSAGLTNTPVFWTLRGLRGIKTKNRTYISGYRLALLNKRITSPDLKNRLSSSVIIITGFSADDNGGAVQCSYLNANGQRMNVTVSIGEDVTIYV